MSAGIIYVLTDTVTGEKYVGQSRRPIAIRWREHQYKALILLKDSKLHEAIRRDGPNAFDVTVVEDGIEEKDLALRERWWIDELGTFNKEGGLNETKGGDAPISPTGQPLARRGKPRTKKQNARWVPPTTTNKGGTET